MRTLLAVVATLALVVTAAASVLTFMEARDQTAAAERTECLARAGLAYDGPDKLDTGSSMWGAEEPLPQGMATLIATAQERADEGDDCD